MHLPASITRRLPARGLARELIVALVALVCGLALMPALIYWAGSLLLGRYEGAALPQTYHTVLTGLSAGSVAAWIVVLGPYALIQLLHGLRVLWRVGTDKPDPLS